jgi:hypothetical protein
MERAEKKRPRGEVGRRCDSDCRARPVWPVAATAANTPRPDGLRKGRVTSWNRNCPHGQR